MCVIKIKPYIKYLKSFEFFKSYDSRYIRGQII